MLTTVLWILLIPQIVLLIPMTPPASRLSLILGLARFLVLTFLVWYTWGTIAGTNEAMIDLLIRFYLAAEATTEALMMEYYRVSDRRSAKDGAGFPNSGWLSRKTHLIFICLLLPLYWGWLGYDVTQIHLR
jgi:hypothetical protein